MIRFLLFISIFFLLSLSLILPLAAGEKDDWDFANGLYLRKMYDMAEKEYRRFTEQYPESAFRIDACYRIAESLWHLEKYREAIPFYGKLKSEITDSRKAEVILLREAMCFQNVGEKEQAKDLLTVFTSEHSTSFLLPTVFYLLAQIESELGHNSASVDFYNRVIESGGDRARLSLYRKGHLLLRMDQMSEAQSAFLQLQETNIRDNLDEDALFKIAEIYYHFEDFSKAAQAYKLFLTYYPLSDFSIEAYKNIFYSLSAKKDLREMERYQELQKEENRFPQVQAFASFLMAQTAFEKKEYEKAALFLQQMEKDFHDPSLDIRKIILSSRIAFARGDQEKALSLLDKSQGLELSREELCDISLIRARTLKDMGRVPQAVEFYSRIIRLKCRGSMLAKAYFEMADCHYRMGEYEKAAAVMVEMLKSSEHFSLKGEAVLKYAEYLSYSGRLDDSIAQLKNFIEQYPASSRLIDAYYRIGINYMKKNDYSHMAGALEELIRLFPDDTEYRPRALYWLGWNDMREEKFDLAKKKLEEIYNRFRESDIFSDAVYWLGVACYSRGEEKEAVYYFMELLLTGQKEIFSEPLLFWLADDLVKNKDYLHAAKAVSWLKERPLDTSAMQKAGYLEISIRLGQKEFKDVLRLSNGFINAFPASPYKQEVLLMAIDGMIALEKFDDALTAIKTLSEQENTDIVFRAFFRKAELFQARDQSEQAAREYFRLAILYDHPLSPVAAYRAYQIYEALGNEEAAGKSRGEILERWPESREAKALKDE